MRGRTRRIRHRRQNWKPAVSADFMLQINDLQQINDRLCKLLCIFRSRLPADCLGFLDGLPQVAIEALKNFVMICDEGLARLCQSNKLTDQVRGFQTQIPLRIGVPGDLAQVEKRRASQPLSNKGSSASYCQNVLQLSEGSNHGHVIYWKSKAHTLRHSEIFRYTIYKIVYLEL